MLIDLHCHTAVHSPCSALSVEMLVERARAAGLDAVCLTEHDATWSEDEVRALSRRLGFTVLRGIEVTTEVGHVLAFGLDRFEPSFYVAASLRSAADAVGALLFLAHPARPGVPTVAPRLRSELFDGVEELNGSDTAAQNEAAAALGARLRLPAIGGSDCHAPHEIGRAATRLARTVRTTVELVAELRRGQHTAVALGDVQERSA